jgi:hypothetical protein
MDDHVSTAVRITGDVSAAMAVVATILGFLPPLAAFVGMVWYCILIYESKTVQAWFARRREKKLATPKDREL